MSNYTARFANIGLRGTTLAARFLFIFFLAKYLDPASVGHYGLFTATVGYCLYFVGLDFYTYLTREILRAPIEQRGQLLKGQAALSGLMYLLLLPLAAVVLAKADWPHGLAWWFFPILLLEYLNQEMSRLLIALSEQLTASLILFVRQGSWAIAIVALMAWDSDSRHLGAVMAFWVCAGVVAAFMGGWKLRQLKMGGWRHPVDWSWVKRGVAISSGFLLATLALRATQTIDRYWLEALGGIDLVGAYVLFFSLASTLMVFLDAGVFAYTYPALIGHSHKQEHGAARAKVRTMAIQTLFVCAVFAIASWLLLPYLLHWISKPIYEEAIGLYPWLMLAMVVNAIGMVPHYALYARGYDKPIIQSHMAALGVFITATWISSDVLAGLAVPLGLVCAFSVILLWKTAAYWKVMRLDGALKSSAQSA